MTDRCMLSCLFAPPSRVCEGSKDLLLQADDEDVAEDWDIILKRHVDYADRYKMLASETGVVNKD